MKGKISASMKNLLEGDAILQNEISRTSRGMLDIIKLSNRAMNKDIIKHIQNPSQLIQNQPTEYV